MIFKEIQKILENKSLNVSNIFGSFPDKPNGSNRAVLTPMGDDFSLYADDTPKFEISSVRIGIFTVQTFDFAPLIKQITQDLLKNDFIITNRSFIGFEQESKYNHYNIDVEKHYSF